MNKILSTIQSTLSNNDPHFLEDLAQQSKKITEQFFGRTITLYAPVYISNYCSSHCTYCGFHSHNRIDRFKLTTDEMDKEMKFLAIKGIENILILTGESYKITPTSYLKEAVTVAKKYFPSISLEVHPMEEAEYHALFEAGVDGITIYQETYDREVYKQVHLSGQKANYDFRYGTPERAAKAGIRSISMGILLGLAPIAKDIECLYSHLSFMEKNFPGVEYSLSFPRLRKIKGEEFSHENTTNQTHLFSSEIDDKTFLKIICMTRIMFPRVGINLSTRESAHLRNNVLGLGITRMSAGSNTAVGGYTLKAPEEQDPQFDIEDKRSVDEIVRLLKTRNYDPVLTDWRRIEKD